MKIQVETKIDASQQKVWAAITDIENSEKMSIVKALQQDLDDIKKYVESGRQ